MARVLFFIVVWVLQIALVTTLASSTWLQAQIRKEQDRVQAYLGDKTASHITRKAQHRFHAMFVETKAVDTLYEFLIPDSSVPKHGTEDLAPWFFEWLTDSLQTFWYLAYQAIYRVVLFSEWLPYLGILIFAAVVDGLVERKIRKRNHGYANPVRYRAGVHALLVLTVAPLLYLTLPFSVTPLLVPLWIFCASAVLMIVAANAQHRI